jgi:hypothetical protein
MNDPLSSSMTNPPSAASAPEIDMNFTTVIPGRVWTRWRFSSLKNAERDSSGGRAPDSIWILMARALIAALSKRFSVLSRSLSLRFSVSRNEDATCQTPSASITTVPATSSGNSASMGSIDNPAEEQV